MAIWYVLLFSMWLVVGKGDDPTSGFTQEVFSYYIQKPYDVDLSQRYSYKNGEHNMWVFSTDSPFKEDSTTKPRTEMRIQGLDYSSGVWQFEGDFYVPSGSTGMAIMQVFGSADDGSYVGTALRVVDGNLNRSGKGGGSTAASDIYDKWLHLNVIHDADLKQLKVYIDTELQLDEAFNSIGTFYFKCGVYEQGDVSSSCMEAKWKNIRVWSQ